MPIQPEVFFLSETKRILKLSAPLVVGNLGHVMYGVVDSIMVGSIGPAPLAASAFVNSLTAFPMVFIMGFASASSVLVAQGKGEGDVVRVGRVLKITMVVQLFIAVLAFVALQLAATRIEIFGQTPEVSAEAIPYLTAIVFSFFPLVIFSAYRKFCDGLSQPLGPTVIFLVGTVLNIFFNYVFIFGKFGFEARGLQGAGFGTIASRVCILILLVGFVHSKDAFKPYLLPWSELRWSRAKKTAMNLLKLGIPSGMQYVFEVGAFAGAAILAGWLGTKALAAHQIAINVATTTFMIALGISIGVSVLVGEAHGQKDLARVRRTGFAGVLLAGLTMTLLGTLFILFKDVIPAWYVDDQQVIALASSLLLFAAVFQFVDGAQAVAIGALRGISDVKAPTIITFVAYWVVGLPVSYFVGVRSDWGAQGIWLGLVFGLLVASVALSYRFHRLTRQENQASESI